MIRCDEAEDLDLEEPDIDEDEDDDLFEKTFLACDKHCVSPKAGRYRAKQGLSAKLTNIILMWKWRATSIHKLFRLLGFDKVGSWISDDDFAIV